MVNIPVIDLRLAGEQPAELERLRDACRRIGCFRVAAAGHGVPAALQADMKAALRSLFDLPADVKRRNVDAIPGSGYMAPSPVNPHYEAFGLHNAASPADVDAFCPCLGAPPQTREIFKRYAEKLHELILGIASNIALRLGLEGYSFENWPCQFRMNKYNFTADTVGSSGVQIHTDRGFLTVLQEDECVGGLEVMDAETGTFVAVDPLPGTFLVNLGDVAKAVIDQN